MSGKASERALTALLRQRVAEMAANAGVDDPVPGSLQMKAERGAKVAYYVESRSRGWVKVGWMDSLRLAAEQKDVLQATLDDLEATRTVKARSVKASGVSDRHRRAYQLMDRGMDDADIAKVLTRERNAKPGARQDRPAINPRTIEKLRAARAAD